MNPFKEGDAVEFEDTSYNRSRKRFFEQEYNTETFVITRISEDLVFINEDCRGQFFDRFIPVSTDKKNKRLLEKRNGHQ